MHLSKCFAQVCTVNQLSVLDFEKIFSPMTIKENENSGFRVELGSF